MVGLRTFRTDPDRFRKAIAQSRHRQRWQIYLAISISSVPPIPAAEYFKPRACTAGADQTRAVFRFHLDADVAAGQNPTSADDDASFLSGIRRPVCSISTSWRPMLLTLDWSKT
jgi:hypothetical protein